MALLEIENLRVVYRSGGREALVVDGVSLTLEKGEYLEKGDFVRPTPRPST